MRAAANHPVPLLLALACASNVGSAATLIGNPQNMLIGESLQLSFARYLLDGGPPAALGLVVTWLIIRSRCVAAGRMSARAVDRRRAALPGRWQSTKGLVLLSSRWPSSCTRLATRGGRLGRRGYCSLAGEWPRARCSALWTGQLLLLFIGFVRGERALAGAGLPRALDEAAAGGDMLDPGMAVCRDAAAVQRRVECPGRHAAAACGDKPQAGAILALASTLAGNLLVVGSIANIIVVEQAARPGVRIDWRPHARDGVPITLVTLAIAAAWLWLRAN